MSICIAVKYVRGEAGMKGQFVKLICPEMTRPTYLL